MRDRQKEEGMNDPYDPDEDLSDAELDALWKQAEPVELARPHEIRSTGVKIVTVESQGAGMQSNNDSNVYPPPAEAASPSIPPADTELSRAS